MKTLFFFLFSTLSLFAQTPLAEVTTNLYIESETSTNLLGWTKQAIMGDSRGKVIDKSGQVVAFADMTAQRTLATNIQAVSSAALQAVTNSVQALWDVTNQIPTHAHHIYLYLPRGKSPRNLVGEVVASGSSGGTEWQVVEYSQYLSLPPSRHIKFSYLNITSVVECVWDEPWDASNLQHRCTFVMPASLRGKMVRTYRHDTIGGENGFDFGSALVTVDGVPTFTGVWTNALNNTIHSFKNGIKIRTVEEASE